MQIARWFTSQDQAPHDLIHMGQWGAEATEYLSEHAFCLNIPEQIKPVEENTLPSWLWRHMGTTKNLAAEHSLFQLFHRVVGSATYKGWKREIFPNEAAARCFYDEAFFLIANKFITLEPQAMIHLGVDWAYGLTPLPLATTKVEAQNVLGLSNRSIDTILSGSDNGAQKSWQRFLSSTSGHQLTLHFNDTTQEWGTTNHAQKPQLGMDLLKFCRDTGTIDTGALQQATKIATLLMEIHYEDIVSYADPSRAIAIAPINLASTLMRLGIGFDDKKGRAMASALCSLLTATATLTSAQLARQFGTCPAFNENRTAFLRIIANRRRAAYGDVNDYEHVSVLPAPLTLDDCPDLALVAEQRHAWDEALVAAQKHGLRNTQLTGVFKSSAISLLMAASTTGIGPEPTLIQTRRIEQDLFVSEIHPVLPMALAHLGYSTDDTTAIIQHAMGHKTLYKAPSINHETLKMRGFTPDIIEKIEAYLPHISDIRLACTPWNIGLAFCKDILKIQASKLEDFDFDLLTHLGFSTAEIITANAYCYGHGTVETAPELNDEHRLVFAVGDEITTKSILHMASSIQSFVTGNIDLTLSVPSSMTAAERSHLLMDAWRQGLKSVSLYFEYTPEQKTLAIVTETRAKPRRIATGKPAPQSATPLIEPVMTASTRKPRKSTSQQLTQSTKREHKPSKSAH